MSQHPKVSVAIPTGDRRHLLPLALACFRKQDYRGELELVVADYGDVPVEDLVAFTCPGAVYIRTKKLSTGAMRNLICEQASGEIIVNFDDDDWSAPDRISDQVTRLLRHGKAVTGFDTFGMWDQLSQKSFYYADRDQFAIHGSSMAFMKSFWQTQPFGDRVICEEREFVLFARDQRQAIVTNGMSKLVARWHGTNVTKKNAMTPVTHARALDREALPQQLVVGYFELTRQTLVALWEQCERRAERAA